MRHPDDIAKFRALSLENHEIALTQKNFLKKEKPQNYPIDMPNFNGPFKVIQWHDLSNLDHFGNINLIAIFHKFRRHQPHLGMNCFSPRRPDVTCTKYLRGTCEWGAACCQVHLPCATGRESEDYHWRLDYWDLYPKEDKVRFEASILEGWMEQGHSLWLTMDTYKDIISNLHGELGRTDVRASHPHRRRDITQWKRYELEEYLN